MKVARREILLSPLLALGCGAPGGAVSTPLPPWHLWGIDQVVNPIVTALPTPNNTVTQQLARIAYGRPDTWEFLFVASVIQAQTLSPGSTINVQVLFDLIVGIGRGVSVLQGFGSLVFTGNAAVLQGDTKWTTAVQAPENNDPLPSYRPNIDHVVAQDIQCSARVAVWEPGGGPVVGDGTVKVQVASYFSPRTHIRPEWILGQFSGDEQAGH